MKQIPLKDNEFLKITCCDFCDFCECTDKFFCKRLGKKVYPYKIDKDCPLQEWGYGQWKNTKYKSLKINKVVEIYYRGCLYKGKRIDNIDFLIDDLGSNFKIPVEYILFWRELDLPEGK